MNTPEMIAIQKRINEKMRFLKWLGEQEFQKACEIQKVIREQSLLSDEIMILEYDLSKMREKVSTSPMVAYANKLLKEMKF